ncbi:hypothetical protein, partial [Nocardioides sp.]|uniref:hypothetical protein n=1 Tax=Nocardioides sp. TaxID=35761 RepID=UPI00356B4954
RSEHRGGGVHISERLGHGTTQPASTDISTPETGRSSTIRKRSSDEFAAIRQPARWRVEAALG